MVQKKFQIIRYHNSILDFKRTGSKFIRQPQKMPKSRRWFKFTYLIYCWCFVCLSFLFLLSSLFKLRKADEDRDLTWPHIKLNIIIGYIFSENFIETFQDFLLQYQLFSSMFQIFWHFLVRKNIIDREFSTS